MGLKKNEWTHAVGISSPEAGQTTPMQSEAPPTVARQEMSKQKKLQLGCIGTSFSKNSPGDILINFIFPELQQVPRHHLRYVIASSRSTYNLCPWLFFTPQDFSVSLKPLTSILCPSLLIQACLHSNTAASKSDLLYPPALPPFYPRPPNNSPPIQPWTLSSNVDSSSTFS